MRAQGSEGFTWRTPQEVRGYIRTPPAPIAAADGTLPEAAADQDLAEALPQERSSHVAALLEGDLLILGGECNGDLSKESCLVDTSSKVRVLMLSPCQAVLWDDRMTAVLAMAGSMRIIGLCHPE